MKISESIYEKLDDQRFADLEQEELCFFLDKKILILDEEKDDYYVDMKFRHQAMSMSPRILSLVVLPTNGCNFACPYCFEQDKRFVFMTEQVLDSLIGFIKAHDKTEAINLTWYGGEPLLGFTTMQKFYALFEEQIKLPIREHSIVTNGYLLTREKILFLRSKGINSMQITLDGVQEHHDRTRCLYPSGKGTYSHILRNVDLALELMPDCQIAIRVNINKETAEDFCTLYKELHHRWEGRNVYIYPGFIREDTDTRDCFSEQCFTAKDHVEFYLGLQQQGINVDLFPKCALNKGCVLNAINSYIIGAEGEIYKCWNDVSNKDKIVGYLGSKEIVNKTLFYRYMTECSPFTDKACKSCNLFPICQGGCGWYRYRNIYEGGKFDICSIYRGGDRLKKALLSSMLEVDSPFPRFSVN